jgi:hypothetical protein
MSEGNERMTMSTNHTFKLPKTIGLAVDFFVPPYHPFPGPGVDTSMMHLAYLADVLFLYETALIRADITTIRLLYTLLSTEELNLLLKAGRIRFCACVNDSSFSRPVLLPGLTAPTEKYFSEIYDTLDDHADFLTSSPRAIVNQVEEFFVPHQMLETSVAEHFQDEMEKSIDFSELPTVPHQPLYHVLAFKHGIGRCLDFWSSGTAALHFDPEMEGYLSLCDMERSLPLKSISANLGNPVDTLHRMNNLPTVRDLVTTGTLDKNGLLKLILSDDAYRLRDWLTLNLNPEMDVRDSFYQSLNKLPSKNAWTAWLRFGSISILTTGFSLVISGSPALAAILGLATGAADTAVGHKVVEKFADPYHPRNWVSAFGSMLDEQRRTLPHR